MAVKVARVLSPWTGTGATMDDARRPQIKDDYPEVTHVEDVTGLPASNYPPDPNLQTVEIRCPEETLNAIAADPRYGMVLWEEDWTPP